MNGLSDIYIHDRVTGVTERVSIGVALAQTDGPSYHASVSADGHFVGFMSNATNLVAGDTNGVRDVFVRDRTLLTTELVSVSTAAAQGNADSHSPSLSSDGRIVAFWSDATNLVAADTNAHRDVFVRDRQSMTTEIASIATGGTQGNGDSTNASISADGLYVSFYSYATNLVFGSTGGTDIFVRNRQNSTTAQVTPHGSNGYSFYPSISADGRFVAFDSEASNIVGNDTNAASDIFVADLQTGFFERDSVSSSGAQGNGGSHFPAISSALTPDGRFIAFSSDATNLIPGMTDTNGVRDIFLRDRQQTIVPGLTRRVSLSSSGAQGMSHSYTPSISADDRFVTFRSAATNLVSGDTNGVQDIFVRDLLGSTTERVSVNSSGVQGNGASLANTAPSSSDGRFVAFGSHATNLVSGDTNLSTDVFVRDRQSGTTERVSVESSSGVQGNDDSGSPSISSDGRFVAFESLAYNLDPFIFTYTFNQDIFVHDRQNGTTECVSLSAVSLGFGGDSYSYSPSISADGRYVAFSTDADDLVPGFTNGARHVFVRDRQSGTTEWISISSSGVEANDWSYSPAISSNGRYVAFDSWASNLVSGDTNGVRDVFVHDRLSGSTERVSVESSGIEANSWSLVNSISVDGRYIVFESAATNLIPDDTNGHVDVFIRDRQTGTTSCISLAPVGMHGNSDSSLGSIGSGRFVAFESFADNLVGGDTNGSRDIFVHDRDVTDFTSLCHPGVDGVIGCPCGQAANPLGGCANHGAGATSGAVLSASGIAYVSNDTLLLTTSNHRSPAVGVLNVFFSYKPGSATPTTGIPSGAGVRCIGNGGSLKRLYTMQVFGGTGSKPGMGDLSVSAKSATFPGHAIAPPETRYYFNVYRDGQASGPCGNTATSTNLTNMGSIGWSP